MDKEQRCLSEQPFTETTQANEFGHKGLLYTPYTWETDHWLILYKPLRTHRTETISFHSQPGWK